MTNLTTNKMRNAILLIALFFFATVCALPVYAQTNPAATIKESEVVVVITQGTPGSSDYDGESKPDGDPYAKNSDKAIEKVLEIPTESVKVLSGGRPDGRPTHPLPATGSNNVLPLIMAFLGSFFLLVYWKSDARDSKKDY